MDLWNRFFHPRRNPGDQQTSRKSDSDEARHLDDGNENRPSQHLRVRRGQSSRGFDISNGGIRVLLFRECERRGRKLLYDSNTVLRVPVTSLSFAGASAPLTTAPVRGLTPLSLGNVLSDSAGSTSRHPKLTSTGSSSSSLNPSSSSSSKGLAQSLSWGAVLSSSSSTSTKPAVEGNKGASLEALRGASKSSDPLSPAPGLRASGRSSEPRKNEIIMEITDDYVYQYCRQASDSKQLGELVFGCVQLAYRGACSKLHTLGGRVVLSRTQPRPPAPSSRGAHPPLPSAARHPTLASDAGVSSMGSSLEVLGRRVSGGGDTSASNVSFYLGGSTDRRLLACDKRSNARSEGPGLRRTSTVVSDLRSSLGGLSVLGSAVGVFPDSATALRRTSTTPSEDDSGFGGPASWFSSHGGSFMGLLSLPVTPVGSVSSKGSLNSSSGSLSNLQKRFLRRTADTSLDCLTGLSAASPSPRDTDAGLLTTKSSSFKRKDSPKSSGADAPAQGSVGATDTSSTVTAAAHTRIGLAVVLSADSHGQEDIERSALERWVVLHSAVLEGCINRLQAALDLAYHNTSSFVSRAHAAVSAFQREVLDLFYGPRLISPVWLELVTSPESQHVPASCLASASHSAVSLAPLAPSHQQQLARRRAVGEALVNSLGLLLREHDTKHTNFFMSRLLTAVLTYHLGWVTSVALQQDAAAAASPVGLVESQAPGGGDDACRGDAQPFFQQPQENESGVLTQLLELQGCLGSPPQCCRTVLLGSSASLLQHCLSLLSYFIRCQQVEERDVFPEDSLDLFRENETQSFSSICQTQAAHERTEISCTDETASQSKATASGINGSSRNSSEVTLQRSLSSGSCRRSSCDSNERRSSGDSNDRRSSGDSNGRRSSGDSNGRRSSGDGNGRRSSGDGNGRRSSGDGNGRRSSGDGNGRRSSGDSNGRRSSGDGNGRQSSGDRNGRRSSSSSAGRRSSSESNSSTTTFLSTTLHRKRSSIQSSASTALETLSELPSAERQPSKVTIADTTYSVTLQAQTSSLVYPQYAPSIRGIDERSLDDLTGFREGIHPCPGAPAVTSSAVIKLSGSTQTTIGWQICPSKNSQAGSQVHFVQDSSSRTSSCSGKYELGNLDVFPGSHSNISTHSPVGFQKSRTSFNLADTASLSPKIEGIRGSQKLESVFRSKVSCGSKLSGSSSDSSTLYPDLTTLDGHCEAFGPAEIRLDVIAAKVRKLCRVTPERSLDDREKKIKKSEDVALGCSPEVKSSSHLEELLFSGEAQEAVNQVTESLKANSKIAGGEVRFCGEMIRSEPEDGKKVIFIVGEDEALDGASTAVSSSKLRRSCSPHPSDFLEMKESRNVARAFCLEELTHENFTGVYRSGSERRLRRDFVLGHKRTSSDPTARRPSALRLVADHPVAAAVDSVPACTEQIVSSRVAAEAQVTSPGFANPVYSVSHAADGCSTTSTIVCSLTTPAHIISGTPELAFSESHGMAHLAVSSETETALATSHCCTSNTDNTTVAKDSISLRKEAAVIPSMSSQPPSQHTGWKPEEPSCALAAESISSPARVDDVELRDPDFDSVILSEPIVTGRERGPVLGVAESVMGGVLDRYSPVFLLQAVINTDSEHFNSRTARAISATSSSPHLVSEGSGEFQSSANGRLTEIPMKPLASSSSSSSSLMEREMNVSRGTPSVHGTLSFASSLFGTSPTRLFGGLSVKNPLAAGTTDRRAGSSVRSSAPLEAVKAASETAKAELLKSLRHHLEIDTRYSQLRANHVAILADLDDWSVRVVTSNSDGVEVGMSPLIASITDSLLQLVLLGAQPNTVLQCLEDKLGEVYRQSLILANYLLGGTTVHSDHVGEPGSSVLNGRPKVGINPGRLADLPSALGLDLNDLPLLLATASSHSPHLATMYGLAIR